MGYFSNKKKNQSSYLFDFIKKKVDLAEFLETEIGCTLQWYEENESAGTVCPMPHHKDTKPSFRIKLMDGNVWVYHCLSGDTKVMTYDGLFPIRELVNTTQKVLTVKSKWVESPFYSFGHQPVSEIVLSRNGQKKILRATLEHRWFERYGKKRDRRREVLTKNLKKGMRMAFMFPENKLKQIASLSPKGISHGLVFGDGKGFPSIDECPSYLAGFLAGWFASDGCVAKDGTASLSSANKENMEFARLIAIRLGMGTYDITGRSRMGLGKNPTMIYQMHFVPDHLTKEFFLVKNHRKRFTASKKKYSRKGWMVESVRHNVGVEEVFCAVVDKYHSFVLEDNILTGNCLGCGSKGTIIDFCMEYYDLNSSSEAIWFICKKFGFKNGAQLVTDSLKDVKKKMNLNRKLECAHIVSANQCRFLLRKDYGKHGKWVSQAYHKMNEALEKEDIDAVESVGFEASSKLRE